MSTMLDQHCIGILFSQCCPNTSEITLHKKCWFKTRRYTFAGKPFVSNMSGSLFLTGCYYITEQSWVFLFNVGSGVYLRTAEQRWIGADIDWNIAIKPTPVFKHFKLYISAQIIWEINYCIADKCFSQYL